MNWPFAWLDILTVAIAVGGLAAAFPTVSMEPSPQRGKFKLIATVCLAFAFLLSGVDSLLTFHLAPHESSTGIISAVSGHGGKNPSCTIQIARTFDTRASDNRNEFTGSFSCYGITVGDEAHIEWLQYNGKIAQLEIVAGSDTGSLRNGGDGFSAIFRVGLGCVIIFFAFRSYQSNPTAIPVDHTRRDSSVGEGVDTQSLLNLSKRD